MNHAGYYRFPTISGNTVVFVSEDDLWSVPAVGGVARRLTSALGAVSSPVFSPDGSRLAFSCKDDGPTDVYIMDSKGGAPTRITWFGGNTRVLDWKDDKTVVVASDYGMPFLRENRVHLIPIDGSPPQMLPYGPAMSISFGPKGGLVIGRNAVDPARWKRYKGGTAGDIVISTKPGSAFKKLVSTGGNLAFPIWLGDRIYFLSDHEGTGNIYSCRSTGRDLKRHTHHEDFYVRFPSSDGSRIVYHSGADLFILDTEIDKVSQVKVEYLSPRTQLNRKFVTASTCLEDIDLHPQNHLLAAVARGKPFVTGFWAGAVTRFGEDKGVRYRLARWLHGGDRFISVSDATGEEVLEIHAGSDFKKPVRLAKLNLGRAVEVKASPVADIVAVSNHRNELILVDLKARKSRILAASSHGGIGGFNWSPDGRWIAFGFDETLHTSVIKIAEVRTGKIQTVTKPVLRDTLPCFDPEGKYLYFLSYREFDPVYDNLHFDLGFPRGVRPYLVTLRNDILSPLVQVPTPSNQKVDDRGQNKAEKTSKKDKGREKDKDKPKEPPEIKIDFDGIENRIQAIPVPEARYIAIEAIKGKVLFMSWPVEGTLNRNSTNSTPPSKGVLETYDFDNAKTDLLVSGINWFEVSKDRTLMLYRAGNRIRIVKAGEKPDDNAAREPAGKKNGWIDIDRIKVSVSPTAEWRQIMNEAWRLQRDHFWTEDMSRINWKGVMDRYSPLLDRVSTRGEFSDLMWEVQGELGSSHAYEMGGDYRPGPWYGIGFLGADYTWDEAKKLWKITRIVQGDPWDSSATSPFRTPGVNVKPGDSVIAIDSQKLSKTVHPSSILVNKAGLEVIITVGDAAGKKARNVTVKALKKETPARYRDWVEDNRRFVHERTNGKIGYVHIPNMGPLGYSEFHRYFLSEIDREGLLVDVRFNGGGHVSQLLLEKLARKRIAYVQTRWFGSHPYPNDSVAGPIVALTNEHAGSDGDIFSHCFKLLKLGPLVGKRTWGGVIGIWARNTFVDGSVTTQPEFSFWFNDVGWAVENYGTDPDIEVDMLPHHYAEGKDPQLERTISEIMGMLKSSPPRIPDLKVARPNLSPPRLSKQSK